jgi:hypothetical protein
MGNADLGQGIRSDDRKYLEDQKNGDDDPPEDDEPPGVADQYFIAQFRTFHPRAGKGEAISRQVPGKFSDSHGQALPDDGSL